MNKGLNTPRQYKRFRFWQELKESTKKKDSFEESNGMSEKEIRKFNTKMKECTNSHELQINQFEGLKNLLEPANYLTAQAIKHEKELLENIKEFSKNFGAAARDLQE